MATSKIAFRVWLQIFGWSDGNTGAVRACVRGQRGYMRRAADR